MVRWQLIIDVERVEDHFEVERAPCSELFDEPDASNTERVGVDPLGSE